MISSDSGKMDSLDTSPADRVQRLGITKTLVYSFVPVLILYAALEFTARLAEIWLPPLTADYGWGFTPGSRLFVPAANDPNRMTLASGKEVAFPKQEFQVPKPPGVFRIFMLGGSSVHYFNHYGLQMGERLGHMAGRADRPPNFEFVNCGGFSYGSHRLVPIAAEAMQYEPDLVLLYTGHNEFMEIEQLVYARPKYVHLQRLLYSSAFLRAIRDRLAMRHLAKMRSKKQDAIMARDDGEYGPESTVLLNRGVAPQELQQRMEAFRNNLSRIIAMCQVQGVPTIMGTVPSNLLSPTLRPADSVAYKEVFEAYKQGQYQRAVETGQRILSNTVRHQSSDAENAIIRSLAEELDVPLADVEAAVIAAEPNHVSGETCFTDVCHLNDAGMQIMERCFRRTIARLLDLL